MKRKNYMFYVITITLVILSFLGSAQKATNYYCTWCGNKYSSVATLVNGSCSKSPTKKHELYEGSEKSEYTCKHCGNKHSSLSVLVNGSCSKSPTKKHRPAL